MKRRIFGLENEYGLTCTLNGQRRLSPDNVARYLFEKVIPGARNANVFLENGARLYLDTGFHPEYATPECDDVAELVIHDKAGERIVEDLLHQAEKRLREDGISGNILLFKNNTDSAGNSYGCHENYLVSRDVSFQRLAEALIPFFVTRQIFAGAGKVLQTPRGFHYCLSQRAQHICQEISGATTSSRSIINTRDEPHADAERYRRLHVIVGDSNMSEVATYLKIGTTALVLDMIEDGFFDRDYSLQSPVQAIRDISHDPTLREAIKLKDGRSITALQLQLEYLDAVVKESLRLWPVVPAVGRRVKVPTQIGGWTIPVGVNVAPMIYLTHRRPDLYPDPDLFRPERFIGVKPDPYAWLPFGGGQRRCAGMAFALAEMKVVLATVLRAARLSLAPGPSVAPRRRGVLLAPTDRARVILEERSSSPEC